MKQSILLDEHLDRLESQDAQYQRTKSNKHLYLLAGIAIFFLALCAGGAFYFFTYYKTPTSSEPLLGSPSNDFESTELSLTQQCGRCEINPLIPDYEICTQCADKLEDDIALTCQDGHYDIKLLATIVEGKNDATVEANIYRYCQENIEEMSSSCTFNYENDVLSWVEEQNAMIPFEPEQSEEELELEDKREMENGEPVLQDVRPGMPAFGRNGHGQWGSHGHGYPPPPRARFPKNKVFIKYLCIETDEEVQEEILLGAKQQGCAPDSPAEEGTEPNMNTLFCSSGHIDLKVALDSGETTQYLRCPVEYSRMTVYKAKLGQKNFKGSRSALNSKCGNIDAANGPWEADSDTEPIQMLEGVDSIRCPFAFNNLNFVLEPAADPSNPGVMLTRRHKGRHKHKGMVTINYICSK